MEAMLPQSLVPSDSDRKGFGDCERRNPRRGGGAGLRPAFISEEFTMRQSLTPRISESDAPKDFGNIASILSLSFRFP